MKYNIPIVIVAFIALTACKEKKLTPFDSDNKWYAVYGTTQIPIILSDTILVYDIDTNIYKNIDNVFDYIDKIGSALKLTHQYKFSFTDSVIRYAEYSDTTKKTDTVAHPYELVSIDSIPILYFDKQFLIPWDRKKNYGQFIVKSVADFSPKMELGGYKIGQEIEDAEWVKKKEEMDYTCGCALGKYQNVHNKNIEVTTFDKTIVTISYGGFSDDEKEELKNLFKYHEHDSLQFDKTRSGQYYKVENVFTDNGTYFVIGSSKNIYMYGYLVYRGQNHSYLRNDNYLKLLSVLKYVKSKKI